MYSCFVTAADASTVCVDGWNVYDSHDRRCLRTHCGAHISEILTLTPNQCYNHK